jgi:hypothetical protein
MLAKSTPSWMRMAFRCGLRSPPARHPTKPQWQPCSGTAASPFSAQLSVYVSDNANRVESCGFRPMRCGRFFPPKFCVAREICRLKTAFEINRPQYLSSADDQAALITVG